MPYVADLVEERFIRAHSEPLDYDQGVALADRGAVSFLQRLPVWVTALVAGERAQLHAAHAHLKWDCTCSEAEGGGMCRHVVALAREVGRRSPHQKTRA
jgi:uncharacterized Zn finger protein